MDLRFPVEERFLPQVSVNPETFHEWRDKAHVKVMQVLRNRESFFYEIDKEKDKHKLVTEKPNFRGYAKKASNSSPGKYDYVCEAAIDGTLEDIAYGTYCENTFEQRVVFAHLYDEQFLDGAVLQVSELANRQDPFQFVGMKWLAISPPAGGFLSPRDYIYFEYSGTASDLRGRKVLFRLMRSVQMDSFELRENDFGFSRGSYYDLHFYSYDRDRVRVVSYGFYDSVGMSSMLVMKGLNSYWNNVVNLTRLADVRGIVSSGLMKTIVPPKGVKAKTCQVCNKAFSLLRAKQSCRGCGGFCCRHCTVSLRFFNEQAIYSASTLPVVSEKFCLQCVLRARSLRGGGTRATPRRSASNRTSPSPPPMSMSVPTIPTRMPPSLKRSVSESCHNKSKTASNYPEADRQFKSQTPSVSSEESNGSDMILLESCHISEERGFRHAVPAPNRASDISGLSSMSSMSSGSSQYGLQQPSPVLPDPFEKMTRSLAAQEDLLNSLKRGMHRQPYGGDYVPASPSPSPVVQLPVPPPQPRNDMSDRFEVLS